MTYLTEAEAREQVCPFIRHCLNENAVIRDGDSAIYGHQNCQASACKMAWRWKELVFSEQLGGTYIPMPQGNPLGYCGIAGRPE